MGDGDIRRDIFTIYSNRKVLAPFSRWLHCKVIMGSYRIHVCLYLCIIQYILAADVAHYHWKTDTASFFADLARVPSCETALVTPTHSPRDSSYTRNWRHEDWGREFVSPHVRYGRHIWRWLHSPTAVALLPMVGMASIWSVLVVILSQTVMPGMQKFVPTSSLAALTAPIALLLTLRTNRALDRLLEVRRAWGVVLQSSMSLTTLILAHVQGPQTLLLVRYISLLGWTLKGLNLAEDDGPVLQTVLPAEEAAWMIQSPGDSPTLVVQRIRTILANELDDSNLSEATAMAMEESLRQVERHVGICKRILGSPIPPTFSRHMSRMLCLYLALLPMGLVGAGVSHQAVVCSTALTCYFFIGIDEIGVEIEFPFRLLPLCSLATILQRNVANLVASSESMPSNSL